MATPVEEIYPDLKKLPRNRIVFIKNHKVNDKTIEQLIEEAESFNHVYVDDGDPMAAGEPVSHAMMQAVREHIKNVLKNLP